MSESSMFRPWSTSTPAIRETMPGLSLPIAVSQICRTPTLKHRMAFPATRMRRLRATGALRGLIRETELTPSHFIYPMFVELGTRSRSPIAAMPGVDRLSINSAVEEAGAAFELGVPAVRFFGGPSPKDEIRAGADMNEGGAHSAGSAEKEGPPDGRAITASL